MGAFRWQSSGGFRDAEKHNLSGLKPKYKNAKEEALQNTFSSITMDDWIDTHYKSRVFMKSFARKCLKTPYEGSYYDDVIAAQYVWKKGEIISLREIVTLKLYTDFDQLQRELKKCFRSQTTIIVNKELQREEEQKEKEKRVELKQRLEEFFHWRSGLLIVLNKFGTKFRHLNDSWTLYHGSTPK